MAERYSDFDLPWCQDLLNSSDVEDTTTSTRLPPPPVDRVVTNRLFSETWRTDSTIRAWKSLRKLKTEKPSLSPESYLLLSLGTGLDSTNKVMHGGASAAMLDQCVNITSYYAAGPTFTKELNVKYRRNVPLPSCVLCRSVLTRREGRALWIRATIEDGEGLTYCEAEALCIVAAQDGRKPQKL